MTACYEVPHHPQFAAYPISGVIQREITWMSICSGRREEAVARTFVLSPMPEIKHVLMRLLEHTMLVLIFTLPIQDLTKHL